MGAVIGIIISAVVIAILLAIFYFSNKNADTSKEDNRSRKTASNNLSDIQKSYFNAAKQEIVLHFKKTYEDVIFQLKNSKVYNEDATPSVVAATVFVATDLPLMSTTPLLRQEVAKQIFDIVLPGKLNKMQMDLFDDACELLGRAVRKQISIRGEWLVTGAADLRENYFLVMYGDLLSNQDMIKNYNCAPVWVKNHTDRLLAFRQIIDSYALVDEHLKKEVMFAKAYMIGLLKVQ